MSADEVDLDRSHVQSVLGSGSIQEEWLQGEPGGGLERVSRTRNGPDGEDWGVKRRAKSWLDTSSMQGKHEAMVVLGLANLEEFRSARNLSVSGSSAAVMLLVGSGSSLGAVIHGASRSEFSGREGSN